MSRKPSPVPGARPHAKITGERVAHFLLTDAYFVAANHGRPITRLGLDSLCLISKSPKSAIRHSGVRPADEPASMDQLEAIRDKWLLAMKEDPARVAPNAAREAELAASLADELIFELMQNANDASAAALPQSGAKLFGKAGKGFRATLNLTDGPRIYSGGVAFAFDPARAHKALKKLLGRETPSEIPILRLPFPSDSRKEPPTIRDLIERYDTVIVMPFRGLKACERCRAAWDEKVDDVTLLKALPALNVMIWEREDATAHYKRTIRRDADNGISFSDEGRKPGPIEMVVRKAVPKADPPGRRAPAARVTRQAMQRPSGSAKGAARPARRRKPGVMVSAQITRHAAKGAGTATSSQKKANGSTASKTAPTTKKTAAPKPAAKPNGTSKKTVSAAATTKSTGTAAKTKASKSVKATKPAAKKSRTASKTAKTATSKSAKKPAKPSSTRANGGKKPSKSKGSSKKA